jgi:hypothetical protein
MGLLHKYKEVEKVFSGGSDGSEGVHAPIAALGYLVGDIGNNHSCYACHR